MQNYKITSCPSCGAARDTAHANWCEYIECPWCSREHRQGQCETDRHKRRTQVTGPDKTEGTEKAVTDAVADLQPGPTYTLSYAKMLREIQGCRRMGAVRMLFAKDGRNWATFDSPENAVKSWLSDMDGKGMEIEDITHLGWCGWGLVYRVTNQQGRVSLYSVMVDEANSSAEI